MWLKGSHMTVEITTSVYLTFKLFTWEGIDYSPRVLIFKSFYLFGLIMVQTLTKPKNSYFEFFFKISKNSLYKKSHKLIELCMNTMTIHLFYCTYCIFSFLDSAKAILHDTVLQYYRIIILRVWLKKTVQSL